MTNYKFTFKKAIKHLNLVNRHRWYVFLACCEAHIPLRGLLHDLSKYSLSEFINSVKYYTGTQSPIDTEKELKGYSYAWLHHRGHNRHHWEYWVDNLSSGGEALKMPLKFTLEMICDWIGAGKAYNKKEWNRATPFDRFNNLYNSGKIKIHLDTYKFIFQVLYDYKNTQKSLSRIIKLYAFEY